MGYEYHQCATVGCENTRQRSGSLCDRCFVEQTEALSRTAFDPAPAPMVPIERGNTMRALPAAPMTGVTAPPPAVLAVSTNHAFFYHAKSGDMWRNAGTPAHGSDWRPVRGIPWEPPVGLIICPDSIEPCDAETHEQLEGVLDAGIDVWRFSSSATGVPYTKYERGTPLFALLPAELRQAIIALAGDMSNSPYAHAEIEVEQKRYMRLTHATVTDDDRMLRNARTYQVLLNARVFGQPPFDKARALRVAWRYNGNYGRENCWKQKSFQWPHRLGDCGVGVTANPRDPRPSKRSRYAWVGAYACGAGIHSCGPSGEDVPVRVHTPHHQDAQHHHRELLRVIASARNDVLKELHKQAEVIVALRTELDALKAEPQVAKYEHITPSARAQIDASPSRVSLSMADYAGQRYAYVKPIAIRLVAFGPDGSPRDLSTILVDEIVDETLVLHHFTDGARASVVLGKWLPVAARVMHHNRPGLTVTLRTADQYPAAVQLMVAYEPMAEPQCSRASTNAQILLSTARSFGPCMRGLSVHDRKL